MIYQKRVTAFADSQGSIIILPSKLFAGIPTANFAS